MPIKTHWVNPWTDAIPVPIEELAACHSGLGGNFQDLDGNVYPLTVEVVLQWWGRRVNSSDKLDACILPSPTINSAGVRYGSKGWEYLSPCFDTEKLTALYNKYRNQ
jgi:hypothetical protein